jgi:hypothetical protein
LKTLSKYEFKNIKNVMEIVIPKEGFPSIGSKEAGVSNFIDVFLSELPKVYCYFIRVFFLFFEFAPIFFIFKFKVFSSLSHSEKERYLKTYEHSRLYLFRMAFTMIKTLCCFGYLRNEEVRKLLGIKIKCKKE